MIVPLGCALLTADARLARTPPNHLTGHRRSQLTDVATAAAQPAPTGRSCQKVELAFES
ncbi:hypothetical protein O2W18_06940 [Modestobacter sp. VKM Ac-2983]|uniref:hypothetical protein n=1 Tax=Modestobacter sp. VKM Ac-2983 TaxID=3004137 RepID=UPI0022ABA8B3|nr:hypothetical protein [Modestobacter sp. VKM Ac-2983]MCZ2804827.1 hypothetical protein [Modestobacter sp. VKM Ac-2983]